MRFSNDSGWFPAVVCGGEGSGGGGLVVVTLSVLVQTFNESASFVLGNFHFKLAPSSVVSFNIHEPTQLK